MTESSDYYDEIKRKAREAVKYTPQSGKALQGEKLFEEIGVRAL